MNSEVNTLLKPPLHCNPIFVVLIHLQFHLTGLHDEQGSDQILMHDEQRTDFFFTVKRIRIFFSIRFGQRYDDHLNVLQDPDPDPHDHLVH